MSELFFDLVGRVELSGKFQEILKTQQMRYQLQPFKIHGIDCAAIRKTYQSLQEKYASPSEALPDPNAWNENERRVFIWFIIFYTYFNDVSSDDIPSLEWPAFSATFFGKNPKFLHFQLLNMIKPAAKVAWTHLEDERLVEAVQEEQDCRWNEVAKALFYNSDCTIFKSPKHCRERWLNHLDLKKKHGLWTPQEDLRIFRFVMDFGKRWCKLVPVLKDTRTEHMIKNRYNSLINKQRKSKKEREEQLCLRIIKHLKKQIQSAEIKKRQDQEAEMQEGVQRQPQQQEEQEEAQEMKEELKMENLTPEEKLNSEHNTNQKEQKSEEAARAESGEMNEAAHHYPFAAREHYSGYQYAQDYYQLMGGYSFVPEPLPYAYQMMAPITPYYWM